MHTLTQLASQIPVYLVLLVGAGVAAARYSRHPQVSGLVIGACLTLIVSSLATMILNLILVRLMSSSGDYRTMGYLMSAVGGAHTILAAVCYGLLIAAAFAGRPAGDDARAAAPTT